MKEQLISFETAKLAKEKGFNIHCHSFYFEDGEFRENEIIDSTGFYGGEYYVSLSQFEEDWNSNWLTSKDLSRCFGCQNSKKYFKTFSAPTQSLLQKWLREVHRINVVIQPAFDCYNICGITKYISDEDENDWIDLEGLDLNDFPSYEEALEDALKFTLKLI